MESSQSKTGSLGGSTGTETKNLSGRSRGVASREAILSAAIRVVGRQGLPAASLGVIAKEAGTSKPAVLYHFGARQKLLREMAKRSLSLFVGNVQNLATHHGEADRTRIAFDAIFSKDNRELLLAVRELETLGARDEEVALLVRRSFSDFEQLLGPLLPQPSEENDEIVSDMTRCVYGFLQRWLCEGVEDPTRYKQGALHACLKLSR